MLVYTHVGHRLTYTNVAYMLVYDEVSDVAEMLVQFAIKIRAVLRHFIYTKRVLIQF